MNPWLTLRILNEVDVNLLAHAYLSPPDQGILVGNVVADWVKGRARLGLPGEVRAGMELHRRIDAFTDLHPLVLRCGELLDERWGRYGAVLVDMFFDHLLAAEWRRHSDVPLGRFAGSVYAALVEYRAVLPGRCGYAMDAMRADDWLTSYATLDGMRVALTRMSARLRHGVELAPAVDDFAELRGAFEEAFAGFFPELCGHVGTGRLPIMLSGISVRLLECERFSCAAEHGTPRQSLDALRLHL